ncbi:hypothetical protein [Bacteriovorax sp. Seq25_V]|uniref:hypothetical protein n=1 Tax=Bacteriovorax sp. Seq25_V TaxID=1201288 RepID=UPI000401C1BC|nr:hypothetical protein [Bacteriovorax sp. Seq25_V]
MVSINNSRGSAIIQVLFAASIVGALGLFVFKSGALQNVLQRQVKVDEYILQTQNEISSLLASAKTCNDSLSTSFSAIGPYTDGYVIDKGSRLRVQKIVPGPRIGREQNIDVFFDFYVTETKSTRTLKKTFPLIYYFSTSDTGAEVENCVSFKAESISSGQSQNCELSGGLFNSSIGRCDYSSFQETEFTELIKDAACKIIGSEFAGTFCNGVNIAGVVSTSHITSSSLDLQGTFRTGLENFSCSGIQVARGFKADGTLDCADVVCPTLSTSTYLAVEIGGEIKCQCQRDKTLEKPSFACGDTDPQSCVDYQVNDGCGLGNLCTIKRGKFPTCPGVAACGETITNSCGEVCSQGAACGTCTDTSWTEDPSTVCMGDVFTQVSNCGSTRSAVGTKDCSSSPPDSSLLCPAVKPYCNKAYQECKCGRWVCSDYRTFEC